MRRGGNKKGQSRTSCGRTESGEGQYKVLNQSWSGLQKKKNVEKENGTEEKQCKLGEKK